MKLILQVVGCSVEQHENTDNNRGTAQDEENIVPSPAE